MAYSWLNYKKVGKEEGPPTTTFSKAVGNGTAFTSSLTDVDVRGRSLEPPINRFLEPLKYQTSIYTINKKVGKRQ